MVLGRTSTLCGTVADLVHADFVADKSFDDFDVG
jgi:hypothetical protein